MRHDLIDVNRLAKLYLKLKNYFVVACGNVIHWSPKLKKVWPISGRILEYCLYSCEGKHHRRPTFEEWLNWWYLRKIVKI